MNIYFISKFEEQNPDYDLFNYYPDWVLRTSVAKAYDYLKEQKQIGFDTETRKGQPNYPHNAALDPYLGKVLLIQLGTFTDVFIFDCSTLSSEELEPILSLLSNEKIMKVGSNLKFDYKMIKGSYGIDCENLYDSQVIDEIIYNGLFNNLYPGSSTQSRKAYLGSFSLRSQVKRHLKINIDEDKKGGKIARTFIDFKDGHLFTKQQLWYAANDIKYPLAVKREQMVLLKKYDLLNLAYLECQVIPCLADMEFNGINIDREKWKVLIEKYNILKDEAKQDLDRIFVENIKKYPSLNKFYQGVEIDIFGEEVTTKKGKPIKSIWDSSTDILNVFRTMKIGEEEFKNYKPNDIKPKIKDDEKTQRKLAKTVRIAKGLEWLELSEKSIKSKIVEGNLPSTNENILLRFVIEDTDNLGNFRPLKPEYQIVASLLKYREYAKVVNTYGENLMNKTHILTGRIHPTFNQLYTETGRLSCENPNLQNIKKEGEFRELFIAEEDHVLVTRDYSGQELVLIAEGSGDPTFIEAFCTNKDVHSLVATILYRKEVTKTNENKGLRTPAKNLNFGLALTPNLKLFS